MSEEHQNAPGNGGIEIDEVVIDGMTYRVRKEVCDEIVNLRRGTAHEIIERIKAIKPKPLDTIIITTPSNVAEEFVQQVGAVARQQFPQNQVAVLPEGLALHTAKGLAQMADLGMQLATAVQDNSPEVAKPLADAFVTLLNVGLAEEEAKNHDRN